MNRKEFLIEGIERIARTFPTEEDFDNTERNL